MFRGKFLAFLEEAFDSGELEFYGQLRELAHPIRFSDLPSSLHNKEWVVYAKPPFGGPDQVLRQLARCGLQASSWKRYSEFDRHADGAGAPTATVRGGDFSGTLDWPVYDNAVYQP